MTTKAATAATHTEFLTLGQLARRIGTTTHRLKYAIGEYGVEPAMRVGITRVWTPDQIPAIESALRRVASNRSGAGR